MCSVCVASVNAEAEISEDGLLPPALRAGPWTDMLLGQEIKDVPTQWWSPHPEPKPTTVVCKPVPLSPLPCLYVQTNPVGE